MDKLVKSVENVHPGKYELRVKELDYIYENYRYDVCGLIAFVFKLGFARGQKAGAAK